MLFWCGVALVIAVLLALAAVQAGDLVAFRVSGSILAALVILVAAAVAVVTLAVAAAEVLLEARRPVASLAALGTEHPLLARAVRRQLTAASAPAAAAGALAAGMPLGAALLGLPGLGVPPVVTLLALLGVHLMVRVAVHALGGRLREVTSPEHLRAA